MPTDYVFKNSKIKKKLPMSTVEQIDKVFVDSGMVDRWHDGSKGPLWYDFMDKEELRQVAGKIVGVKVPSDGRKFFTKSYEVYVDPKAKDALDKKKVAALLSMHSTFVILVFDYRSNVGRIEMESKEFPSLVKFFPILNCIIEEDK
jgi:hypothetical protein